MTVLDELRAIHQPQDGLRRQHPITKQPTDQICSECDRPWPCNTAMLIDRVDPDDASEYGRLLAWRDRLIDEGANPDELEMPEPPS